MEIFQIVLIGIVSTILAITIKKQSPDIGIIVSVSACILIFVTVIPWLSSILDFMNYMQSKIPVNTGYIGTVIKIIGIAYIAEFGYQICNDAGETAIAQKIDLSARILIMVISMPIFVSLIELIFTILP